MIRIGLGSTQHVPCYYVFDEGQELVQSRGNVGPIVTRSDIRYMCSLSRPEEVEDYLTKGLKASHSSEYEEFNSLVRSFRLSTFEALDQRRNVKRQKAREKENRVEKYRRAKVANCFALIDRIVPFLHPYVADIFEGTTSSFYYTFTGRGPSLSFRDYWIQQIMVPYTKAPTRYHTENQCRMIAEQLLVGYIHYNNM